MYKLITLDKTKYDNFVKSHNKSHFLQSYSWGEFCKAKKDVTPYYLGLVDSNNKIVAACLLLQKYVFLNYYYFYSPRGFIIDYNDSKLVKIMTREIIKFTKSKKSIFFVIDPDIIIKKYNYLDEQIKLDYNYKKIFNNLKDLGYKHLGFTKNFETRQPRYSFRIDLGQDIEDIKNHFSKTTKKRIEKSKKLNTSVEIGTKKDIKTFNNLMSLTEVRKDFISYDEDYYETLYDVFNGNKNTKAILFLGKVNLDKTIKTLSKDLKRVSNQISILPIDNLSKSAKNKLKELTKQKEHLQSEIIKFKEYKDKYGNNLTLSAHFIVQYGNKAWVLFAGNHNILTETYVNYHTYFEHIKYAKNEKLDIYDQFGAIGDFSKDNPRLGVHEFKKKFGGDYVEFIGEFTYVTNKLIYFIFKRLVPIYRNHKYKKTKKNKNML
ncbi:MAG: peptidoglycan bridge formation glycyltransferase FemA/FemB family protein [Bacilli bacterium]|nr:peptidoglycan bridge formation glycyltransferase FemA/FemB family protein [Bacilli bacterium]